MNFSDFIYRQTDGFLKAGKNLEKPQDETDLKMSRGFALGLAVFTLLFYGFLVGFSISLPARIHLRALLYLAPMIWFIVRFYKGISIRWMFRGLLKYWLIPALLVFIWIVLVQMFYLAFFGGGFRFFSFSGGFMMVAIGYIFFIYFRKRARLRLYNAGGMKMTFREADPGQKAAFIAWNLMSLIYVAVIAGGLIMLLNATGFWEWLFKDFLGW
ncbi:MAG: hypothetical protein JXA03_07115 [Bacteroidales bacterium]|nr:hypothetical protein [Bacteroidales bacterium]